MAIAPHTTAQLLVDWDDVDFTDFLVEADGVVRHVSAGAPTKRGHGHPAPGRGPYRIEAPSRLPVASAELAELSVRTGRAWLLHPLTAVAILALHLGGVVWFLCRSSVARTVGAVLDRLRPDRSGNRRSRPPLG